MSHRNGVAVILKRTHCPHMIILSVHCVAHRLALATSQVAASVNVNEKELGAIYSYFEHSAARANKLAEMQKIFNNPHIQPKKMFEGSLVFTQLWIQCVEQWFQLWLH